MVPFGIAGFQDQFLKPLGHPSVILLNKKQPALSAKLAIAYTLQAAGALAAIIADKPAFLVGDLRGI